MYLSQSKQFLSSHHAIPRELYQCSATTKSPAIAIHRCSMTTNPALPPSSEWAAETRDQSPRRGSTAQDLLHCHDQRDAISLPEFSATQSIRGRLVQRRLSNVPNGIDDELTRDFAINTYTLVRQEPRWYDWIVRMWQENVSIKVDARYRRDHLGTFSTSNRKTDPP